MLGLGAARDGHSRVEIENWLCRVAVLGVRWRVRTMHLLVGVRGAD